MDERCKKIIKIFSSMEYSPKEDNNCISKEWFENKQNFESFIDGSFHMSESDFSTVLKSSKKALESWVGLKSQNKRKILSSLLKVFDSNAELLCEVDAKVRKIEKSETRDFDIPLIKSYFEYFFTWPEQWEGLQERNDHLVHLLVDVPCPPVALAWLVAPSLSSGRAIIIHATKNFIPLAALFAELCCKASSSLKGLINVYPLPEIENNNIPWLQNFITDFNINNQNYIFEMQPTISLNSSLCSIMLVYESADLDSAAQTAIDWSLHNNGLVPWSIRRIYVQESVLKKFENKLILRLSRKELSGAGEFIKKGLQEARSLGLKVIQEYLILGGDVPSDMGLLCLSAFRTVRESVSLCQDIAGLASVSVWAEKGTVAHCVARNIKVGTVWINCHGRYDPTFPISFINSGNNFGTCGNINRQVSFLYKTPQKSGNFDRKTMDKLDTIILNNFSACTRWQSLTWIKRAQILLNFLDNYEPISTIKDWLELGKSSISNQSHILHSFCALGVIVLRFKQDIDLKKAFTIILDALIVGNSLIICSSDREIIQLKEAAEKSGLPAGLISQVDPLYYPYLASDNKVAVAWPSLPNWIDHLRNRLALVTFSKSIWIPDGEIFAN